MPQLAQLKTNDDAAAKVESFKNILYLLNSVRVNSGGSKVISQLGGVGLSLTRGRG